MREIKFRAWNSLSNKMIKFEDVCRLTISELATETELKFMQCTGLKDKNGVEIYDNDILKVYYPEYSDRMDYEPAHTEINVIRWHDLKCSKCGWAFGDDHLIPNLGYTEVIGNIYENPNLLP